ncbi:MAG: pyridoxamine 5'-phosphate oxidase family protein [SAR202 cluster bacterium]|nr:pyridoxamine 5'-phosphate oxidase family protein [SAR202 cluster bacterium]
MTPDEIDILLRRPLISYISTVRPDGGPHVTPVWHHYDGERAFVVAEDSSVKVNNLRLNPQAVLCIPTAIEPYKYVLVRGSTCLGYDSVNELTHVTAMNYLGNEEGKKYAKEALDQFNFIAITITPEKITSMDAVE